MLHPVSGRLILANGRVYTGERFAEAVGLEGERVRAVGTLEEVKTTPARLTGVTMAPAAVTQAPSGPRRNAAASMAVTTAASPWISAPARALARAEAEVREQEEADHSGRRERKGEPEREDEPALAASKRGERR